MQARQVAPADCAAMREAVREGATFAEVAAEFDVIYETVQYHVRDRCGHEVSVEPVPY